MNILYVSTSTETGGAETALRRLVCAAQKAGHTVKIISLKPLGPVGQDLLRQGFDVLSLDLSAKFSPLENAGALARLIKEIETFSPHIVHAFLYRGILFCRLAKRRVSFKLVTTPHFDLSQKNYLLRLLDRALNQEDDLSCAESRSTADFLKNKQKYPQEKLRLICNGVDLNHFCPSDDIRHTLRSKYGWLDENVVFICVARLSAEKNHKMLLEAFSSVCKRNPQVRLVLVGDGPEKQTLQELIRQKNIEQAVLLTGEVADVAPLLAAADVFVLPSSIESLPMALLEACSCGLPAIVSKAGDMPLVVHHGENGFVCNTKDSMLLSVLMAELTENKDLRLKMGKASRKRMQTYYPEPEQKYLEIYKELK